MRSGWHQSLSDDDFDFKSLCVVPILVWAQWRECDVVRILVGTAGMGWEASRPKSLNSAVARVRVAGAVIRADTQGRVAERPYGPWEDFLALAEPHIRFAVRASRCRARDVEDCVQEAWLQVVQCVDRVDLDPSRGSLACWLQTLARRSACRYLGRQARAAATPQLLVTRLPGQHDPERGDPLQPNPAVSYAERESLAICLDLLRKRLGARALHLVRLYMADQCSLTGIAPQLDMPPGQFWHLWRTVRTFLRNRLEAVEA